MQSVFLQVVLVSFTPFSSFSYGQPILGAYYLPMYFQVLGSSATGAGVRCVEVNFTLSINHCHLPFPLHRMLPFSLGCALFSAVSGIIVTRSGEYRPIMWISWAVFTLGFGLMIKLDDGSNTYVASRICSELAV